MKKLKLKIWDGLQDDIRNLLKLYPFVKSYYDRIADELGCRKEELVGIAPYSPQWKEGFKLWNFFPNDKSVLVKISSIPTIYSDNKSSFSFGNLNLVEVSGIKFYAENNGGEYIVYANPDTVEPLISDEDESMDE